MRNYRQETKEFLERIGAKVKIEFIKYGNVPSWWNSSTPVNIYRVTVSRNGESYTYRFHDSIHNTANNIKPDEYDVLSCVEKYDVGSLEDFCDEFGYDIYDDYGRINRNISKLYHAVVKEVDGINRVFGDVINELAEICS